MTNSRFSPEQKKEIRTILKQWLTEKDHLTLPERESIERLYDCANVENSKNIHVSIDDGAFLTILTSSVESYPGKYMGDHENNLFEGEVLGHLYGDIEESDSSIKYTVRAVSVMHNYEEQTDESVCPSEYHYQKIRYVTDAFKGIRMLGSFHSHPYPLRAFEKKVVSHFSEADLESTRYSLPEYDVPPLEMILALSHLTNEKYKSPMTERHRITNFCRKYKYILSCFAYSFNTLSLEEVDHIRCRIAEKPINY